MADEESPSSPRRARFPTLKDYVPHAYADEASISTRGQNLPSLVSQSRSTSNLAGLRTRGYHQRGRKGSFGHEDALTRRQSHDSSDDHEPDGEMPHLARKRSHFAWSGSLSEDIEDLRRLSVPASMITPQMRSQRLIGNNNPRYRWEQYWKSDEQLKEMKKPLRKYYERTNYLIQNYLYIDRLLDSSLPQNLLEEYDHAAQQLEDRNRNISTISEEVSPNESPNIDGQPGPSSSPSEGNGAITKLKRTPRDLYRIKESAVQDAETTPLLTRFNAKGDVEEQLLPPEIELDDEADSSSKIVTLAIYVNLVANTVLLIMKIVVVALSSSVSVLASLVDAALDFLSTAIVWTTTRLISHNDSYSYPIGRRRLEPIGVLVFSVIMITSFVQVGLEGINKLSGEDHEIVQLGIPAIAIMLATVVIKFLCWLWCRLIKNSSVQALAQDAMTDVVFNIFSIIFPLVGYYARVWWLDPLGGILLSLWVILNWAQTSSTHIRNLTGAAASADERNILLYLTMRFAKTIRKIQGLQAYHSGDKLNVEVDIVLDEHTNLRDSHDLGESLQYVLESVPTVDRAFVHMDYADYNLPSHMQQDS